jgi:glutathione reductase (NADPH)
MPRIDWPSLVRSKNAFTGPVPKRTEKGFQKAGMATFHGHARFSGTNQIRVDDLEITAKTIVIATGADPSHLGIEGEDLLTTSEVFMDLTVLPREIVFIGGGYISFEFAHVANQAGSKVTVLQRGDRVLKRFDPDLVDRLVDTSRESGISIRLQTCVSRIEKHDTRLVTYCLEDADKTFECDMVVHGAGRVPAVQDLKLEAGNVACGKNGIEVNDYLQSVSNPSVYAIGDAADTPYPLATTADMEGEVAAKNIIHGNHVKADYSVVPSVVFSLPPLASVGMSEVEAQKSSKKIRVNTGSMAVWPSSKRIGQTHAGYKVILDEDSHLVLGAHLLGHNSEEVINIFAMAMRFQLTIDDLKRMLWAYPTYVSDIKYMID